MTTLNSFKRTGMVIALIYWSRIPKSSNVTKNFKGLIIYVKNYFVHIESYNLLKLSKCWNQLCLKNVSFHIKSNEQMQ